MLALSLLRCFVRLRCIIFPLLAGTKPGALAGYSRYTSIALREVHETFLYGNLFEVCLLLSIRSFVQVVLASLDVNCCLIYAMLFSVK